MIYLTTAIQAIKADAQVSIVNEDINRITWHDDNPTNITNQQITDKQAELQADYDAKEYQRDRTKRPEDGGYPSIGDQLDMMWHDKKDGTTTWKDAIQAIKDAHSKP
tara:strand:+ start:453 stop:773 length:321 start_codon:yes stop_codon:yes gene_type:complete